MHNSLWLLSGLLLLLILISAFFSASETGMMSVNRYRLRHLSHQRNIRALRVQKLLDKTDKLLSVILIGNTIANLFASSLATMIASQFVGDWGIVVTTIVLSIVILVVAEVTPKTIAAAYPQNVAFFTAIPLKILLNILYPFVWLVSTMAKYLLKLFGIVTCGKTIEPLSSEELRTLVEEGSNRISNIHQEMLLRILDLEKMTVDDVMVPHHQVMGINLDQPWEKIHLQLKQSQHTRLPIYEDDINQVQGMINLHQIMPQLQDPNFKLENLKSLMEEIYFIPKGTALTSQLLNFRREKQRIALIVNEYGDVIGLVTVEDILEEIVGELTSEIPSVSKLVKPCEDGGYLVAGQANIRELNRLLGWKLPTDGPKTLSGLIIEYLEAIPCEQTCLKLQNYPIEIITVQNNLVEQALLLPPLSGV